MCKVAKNGMKAIKEDLIQQLTLKNMTQSFYMDLVDQYVDYYKLKNDLMKDIKERGVRLEVTSGNGFTTSKANESIVYVNKVTQMMLKILNDLDLKQPVLDDTSDDDYL